ncbi:MAG: VOC family protein [Acidobacteria bacterium]|nr:VOC family protein [Acidobacteriota bacterium]
MVDFKAANATVPASDMERAMAWYADKLGLEPTESEEEVGAFYGVGSGRFLLYPSPSAGTNQATAMSLEVDDLESAVAELKTNGVVFEDYDIPGVETKDNIATFEAGGRVISAAWFKDSEGNTLSVGTG